MGSISPLTVVLGIVLAMALAGAIAAFTRDRRRLSGYEDLMHEALRLGRSLQGEVFRDGADLVVSGEWNGHPVMVRFSHAENTPGVNLRMGVPASFTLAIASSRDRQMQGKSPVRTPDEMFNARFSVRSDEPTQAGLFLTGRQVMPALQKLCRSGNTYLLLTVGMAELSDLTPPDEQSVRWVSECLEALDKLAAELRNMPGADLVKIESLKRERSIALRAAIALGVVTAVTAIFMAARPIHRASKAPIRTFPAGVLPSDGLRIPGVAKWRLATPEDLDPDAVGWLRGHGVTPASRLPGNYCGGGASRGVAYLLVGPENARRLVLLCDGSNVYDVQYRYLGIAVRIPKEAFSGIKWSGPPPPEPQGDGMLTVRVAGDPASGIIFFATRDHKISSAVPLNYQLIKLE